MFLSTKKMRTLLLLVLASVSLSACGGTTSHDSTGSGLSETTASLSLEDLVIKVDDSVPLNPVFTPTSAATSVSYVIADAEVVAISRSGILTGRKAGATTVTATSETNLTATFSVTVNEKDEVELSPLELFNEYGQFEDESLPGWALTGTTAEKHVPEIDADREEDMALKLWTGDYSADDEAASLVDFTMTSTFTEVLPAGDYTLSLELVGSIAEITLTLEGVSYSRQNDVIAISGGAYRQSWIEFTLATDKTISLSITFLSPGTLTNWGYLDNVTLHEGHVKPVLPDEPSDGNYLKDGSFEIAGSQTGFLSEATNAYLDWQIAGALRTGEQITFDGWAGHEDYSLKYNYWPSTSGAAGNVKVFQTFTLDEGATFNLNYYVASGGITNIKIYILVDGVEVSSTLIPNSGSYSQKQINDIVLPAGLVEFGIHIQEGYQTWMHLDYMLLTIK